MDDDRVDDVIIDAVAVEVWRRWKYLRTDIWQVLKNLRKKDFDPLLAKVQLGSTDQNREL